MSSQSLCDLCLETPCRTRDPNGRTIHVECWGRACHRCWSLPSPDNPVGPGNTCDECIVGAELKVMRKHDASVAEMADHVGWSVERVEAALQGLEEEEREMCRLKRAARRASKPQPPRRKPAKPKAGGDPFAGLAAALGGVLASDVTINGHRVGDDDDLPY